LADDFNLCCAAQARRCDSTTAVVDDFIDRVMTDPRLNANPAVNVVTKPGTA